MKVPTMLICALAGLIFLRASRATGADHFAIRVVDDQTGRGVPLVELKTVNQLSWWTDSNGIIALAEPGLMGLEVYCHVRGHGYEYPKDFFGFRGVKLKPMPGGSATVRVKRLNIAERLYRVTGEGIYRDSVLAGSPAPTQQPLLNGQVMGQDTVIATPYRGKIYWFWGDTERIGYPLGNFGASGATSAWPGRGGLDPSVGVDLTYFVDEKGFSKPMCPLPGRGLRWIEGLLTLPDEHGAERLVARVANHRDLGYAQDWHLMVFNDEKGLFESIQRWELHEGHDSAHPFRARVDGVEYYYLYPNWRVKPDLRALADLGQYEAFTCVAGEGKWHGGATELDRDVAGRPQYSWKRGADRLHPGRMRELVAMSKLKPEESWIQLRDFESGEPVEAGRGSVFWNEYCRRWVMLMSGKPGEIWFATGDTPVGPWVYARRVVAHENYNFYNPTQHPFFDQDGGRLIYFEGTYTASFSAAKEKTPRYDYNQIMYRLALDDLRLGLPAPVYRLRSGQKTRLLMRERVEEEQAWDSIEGIAFFAVPPAPGRDGLVACHTGASAESPRKTAAPLFYALPPSKAISAENITGSWRAQVKTAAGDEFGVDLDLTQSGTAVQAASPEGAISGSGSFEEGRLMLRLTRDRRPYSFTALLHDRQLRGEWQQTDRDLRGTWSAVWADSSPSEERSPAVVPLYEYRRADDERFYGINPDWREAGWERSAEPVGRVWKNPATVLALDWVAKPVLLRRGESVGPVE